MELERIKEPDHINVVLLYCSIRNGYYGLGTHVGNLVSFLQLQSGIKLTIVKTDDSSVREICSSFEDGIKIVHIPSAEHKIQISAHNNLLQKRYAARVAELIGLQLPEKSNLVFLVNSADYLNLCQALKTIFEKCNVMYLHHAWSWKYLYNISDDNFSRKWKENLDLPASVTEVNSYQQKMAECSELVITVTKQAQSFFVDVMGIPVEKIRVIYNGISDPGIQLKGKKLLRNKYGFSSDDKIIIFSGRVQKEKGIHYLLKAFKLLADRYPSIRLIIVGDGNLDEFLHLANPFWNKITYTGLVAAEQLKELYTLSDIGVLPSMFEQCSYTAIEMRFHRLPVIVTAVDGLDEMFEDKFDALKVPVYEDENGCRILDETGLARLIDQLLNDQQLCRSLADNGYHKALQKFTSHEMFQKYYHAIRSMTFQTLAQDL